MSHVNYLCKNCLIRLLIDVDDSPNRIYKRGAILIYDNSDRNTGNKPYYGAALLRKEFEIV